MFKSKLENGFELRFQFIHYNPFKFDKGIGKTYDERKTKDNGEQIIDRSFYGTKCLVFYEEEQIKSPIKGDGFLIGKSFLSPLDNNFNKKIGSKLALKNLLKKLSDFSFEDKLTKEDRRKIWYSYLMATKQKIR
jgi:hypothetical protein